MNSLLCISSLLCWRNIFVFWCIMCYVHRRYYYLFSGHLMCFRISFDFKCVPVFVLSPDQLLNVIPNSINDNVCFVWMDGTTNNRKSRFRAEKRLYNFTDRDYIEKRDIQSFVKCMYGFDNSRVIYFNEVGDVISSTNTKIG